MPSLERNKLLGRAHVQDVRRNNRIYIREAQGLGEEIPCSHHCLHGVPDTLCPFSGSFESGEPLRVRPSLLPARLATTSRNLLVPNNLARHNEKEAFERGGDGSVEGRFILPPPDGLHRHEERRDPHVGLAVRPREGNSVVPSSAILGESYPTSHESPEALVEVFGIDLLLEVRVIEPGDFLLAKELLHSFVGRGVRVGLDPFHNVLEGDSGATDWNLAPVEENGGKNVVENVEDRASYETILDKGTKR